MLVANRLYFGQIGIMVQHTLIVKGNQPPTVEFDPEAGAAYIRFKRAKVAETVDRSTRSFTLTVDLDARGEVIGIEAIGCEEIVIEKIMARANVEAPHVPLGRARLRATPARPEHEHAFV